MKEDQSFLHLFQSARQVNPYPQSNTHENDVSKNNESYGNELNQMERNVFQAIENGNRIWGFSQLYRDLSTYYGSKLPIMWYSICTYYPNGSPSHDETKVSVRDNQFGLISGGEFHHPVSTSKSDYDTVRGACFGDGFSLVLTAGDHPLYGYNREIDLIFSPRGETLGILGRALPDNCIKWLTPSYNANEDPAAAANLIAEIIRKEQDSYLPYVDFASISGY